MIYIEDGVYISADSSCYSLVEKRVAGEGAKNPGEEYYVPLNSYHATVSGALSAYMKHKQRKWVQEHEMTLCETIEAFQRIERETQDLLAGLVAERLA